MNAAKALQGANRALGIVHILLGVLTIVFLIMQLGRGNLSERYALLYIGGALVVVIMSFLFYLVDFTRMLTRKDVLRRAVFLYEADRSRPLSFALPFVVFAWIALATIIYFAVSGAGVQAYAPPNPYSTTILSAESLAQETALANYFNVAWVPAYVEEGLAFIAVQAFAWIAILTGSVVLSARTGWDKAVRTMTNPISLWSVTIVGIALVSFVFAVGHGAYEGDNQTLITAGVFEFVMQLGNQATGGLYSPIVHFAHNAGVVSNQVYGLIPYGGNI